jgi:hypothetical protein
MVIFEYNFKELKNIYNKKFCDGYWHRLSMNPNITWKIIKSNPDKPWNWIEIIWIKGKINGLKDI